MHTRRVLRAVQRWADGGLGNESFSVCVRLPQVLVRARVMIHAREDWILGERCAAAMLYVVVDGCVLRRRGDSAVGTSHDERGREQLWYGRAGGGPGAIVDRASTRAIGDVLRDGYRGWATSGVLCRDRAKWP